MDFVKDLGRKKESKKLSHIENKNIIENYNTLVEKYNQLAEDSETEKRRYEEELRLQKDVTLRIESKFSELQKHVDRLLESYESLEKENARLEEVNRSLEKYIEIMDKTKKLPVKNERGAGRKKKYNQDHIDRIINLKNSGKEYLEIVDLLNSEFEDMQWGIKEVKYVFTRYKNMK